MVNKIAGLLKIPTKTTHMGLQIDAHENMDGQNNSVIKELMDSTLIIESIWYPV